MTAKQKAEAIYLSHAIKLGRVDDYKEKAKADAIKEVKETIGLYYNDFDEHKLKIDYLKNVIDEIQNL